MPWSVCPVFAARQEEEHTIKTQILVLKEFAEKNGCTIVKEYIDEGWSGDILARPSLDELRTDAKKKIWQAVLIYDPDRLARRYSYQELVMDELREAGIEIIFITVSAPKNSEDKILHGVRGLFAEYERAKIAERFRLGKLRKIKEGHILVSEAPYGYHRVRIQDGKPGYYEVVEEEAKVVKEIFEWVAFEGLTIRNIVLRLHTKKIIPRKNKRGVWSCSSISNLLNNTAYIGEARWGSSYAVVPETPRIIEKYKKLKKTSKKKRPREEWLIIPVPAIIDKGLFQKARDVLRTNFIHSSKNKKHEYLLSGKIFCSCGKNRIGEGKYGGKFLYYRCTDKVKSYPLPPNCFLKGINVRVADELVWNKIKELMSSPELIREQANRWFNNKMADVQSNIVDTKMAEKEIVRLKDQEDRYNKAYGAGIFSIEKLQGYILPIRDKITHLHSEIRQFQNSNNADDANIPTEEKIHEFASKSSQALMSLNFKARRAIVLNVIDKIIGTKQEFHIKGCIPLFENGGLCTINRDSQDTNRLFETRNNKAIPFEFKVELPIIKQGVDYGFRNMQ